MSYSKMEICYNCQIEYPIEKGLFCMKTTPYYSLENCTLNQEQLLELARLYDKTSR